MARRPQGTRYAKITGDGGSVKTGQGILYSLFLSWRGVTAGNRVVVYDSTSASGTVIEEIILSNANSDGLTVPLPAVGKQFATGLYIKPALTGGEMDISVGYD